VTLLPPPPVSPIGPRNAMMMPMEVSIVMHPVTKDLMLTEEEVVVMEEEAGGKKR